MGGDVVIAVIVASGRHEQRPLGCHSCHRRLEATHILIIMFLSASTAPKVCLQSHASEHQYSYEDDEKWKYHY